LPAYFRNIQEIQKIKPLCLPLRRVKVTWDSALTVEGI